jgi:Short C-terminal domain
MAVVGPDTHQTLTGVATGDAIDEVLGLREAQLDSTGLDPRTFALVNVAALIALDAPEDGNVRATPPSRGISSDAMEKLQELGKLRDQGILTDDEFATQKERLPAG